MNHFPPKDIAAVTVDFNPAVEAMILARISERLAHDCNNQLAGILAVGEEFQFHLEDGQPFPGGLKSLHEKVMRLKQLVQRMVELPAKSEARMQHNLNDLVVEAAEMTRQFLPRNVQVETALAAESLPVYADAAAFRWLLIELAWAAAGAATAAGKLSFTTLRQAGTPRPGVVLTLTVSGQIKPPGKNSGAEFLRVTTFVEKHGGVFSVEKSGAVFQLWLPEADFTETEAS
jgi:nitrogen-specific signal transduction histidine kinase